MSRIEPPPVRTNAAVAACAAPCTSEAPAITRLRGSRSESTPPKTRTSASRDLAHREDDAEIGRGADVEHRERERDAGQAVADRGDHGAAEQQPEVALLERAKVLSQPHDSGQPSSTR